MGYALREGLGIGGVRGPQKSELRKGSQSTHSGDTGYMDTLIAA